VVGPDDLEPAPFPGGNRREGGFELLPHVHAFGGTPLAFDVLGHEDVGAAFAAPPSSTISALGPSMGATAEMSACAAAGKTASAAEESSKAIETQKAR